MYEKQTRLIRKAGKSLFVQQFFSHAGSDSYGSERMFITGMARSRVGQTRHAELVRSKNGGRGG